MDEPAVGPLGWSVESDEDKKVVVLGSLAVVPFDLFMDKSVLGHISGKGILHADQRAGLVTLE